MTVLLSGPPSCLCSEVGECENTGDNEVDIVPNIFQVKGVHVEEINLTYNCRRRIARTFVPPTLSVATTLGKDVTKIGE